MKYTLASVLWLLCLMTLSQSESISSPDGRLVVNVSWEGQISAEVKYDNKPVIDKISVAMDLAELGLLGIDPVLENKSVRDGSIRKDVLVPTKDSKINEAYNELLLTFKGDYQVLFRVFNNAMSYRFVTDIKDDLLVKNEILDLALPPDTWSYFARESSLYSHFEQQFNYIPLDSIGNGEFTALPVRFDLSDNIGLLVTEADHFDYPGLLFEKGEGDNFRSKFPKYILETKPADNGPDRNEIIVKEGNYIARTSGKRGFPWRIFMVSDDDRDFVEKDLVYALSRDPDSIDFSWVKPGKIAWDWYNANNVYGVDFEAGINTETYKYYIDFASQYGLEYVILDEGWSKSTTNIMESRSEINIPELVDFGNQKGVGLILWALWKPLNKDLMDLLAQYNKWGVKGIKVDFMQRADQAMVGSYEQIARESAKNQLLVDFHGAFKPAGLRSAYPNILSYEGVMGNEHNKWSSNVSPEHNVTLPFTRMVAGPMDYTPGAMSNAQQRNYNVSFLRPMSLGTRGHEVAMYVVYESALQMLCDAPSAYLKEKEITQFISAIPTTWDETRVLHGKIADYIVVARKKGDTWYIGAMTDWTERTFDIDLSFLEDGTYTMTYVKDGINASRHAEDYVIDKLEVTNKSQIKAKLAPGGGWTAILQK